jgi:hypothetical protein
MAKPCAESKARIALGLPNHYVGNLTYFSSNEWERALRAVSIGQDVSEDLIQAAIARYLYYKNNRDNLVPTFI